MIVDANLLRYARNSADERHEQAREWLESVLNGPSRVGLLWWSLAAFVRIATNPRAYPDALTPAAATRQVEEWLDAPCAWLAEPTANFRTVFLDIVRSHGVRGPLVVDAQLAALALDHGVPIASTDADFARFREVDWFDPLAGS